MNPASSMQKPPSTLVLGLGKTGYSVIEHLAARGGKITVADSRERAPCLELVRAHHPRVEVITGGLPLESFARFDRVVVSPGIAVSSERRLVSDIELFAESLNESETQTETETGGAPVIAITGSNGKSTVTTLVSAMLAAAGRNVLTGGNIGTPALKLLAQPPPDFYVLELSSFQLENTHSLRPAAAAILNISEDHMDRYRHIDQYVEAKARILNHAAAPVLNRDDPALAPLLRAHPDAVTFGLDRPAAGGDGDYGLRLDAGVRYLCRGETKLAEAASLALPGEQNIANALAALALVQSAGVPLAPAVVDALLACRGLEHRCELAAVIDGVRWINDSKGTNVGATVAAIEGFGDAPGGLILIAGGLGKGADFTPLGQAAGRGRVGHAVLFGEDAGRIADALASAGAKVNIARAEDLRHAVSLAAGLAAARARAGQVVLFSPACASFDLFEDYEQRGRAFKQLVGELETTPR